jgi:predicted DNA-binding ribbon-helix-helix protein
LLDSATQPVILAAQKERKLATKKEKREKLKMVGVRIEESFWAALEEIALADPERATVSTLIRRAIREYLQRQGKLKAGV